MCNGSISSSCISVIELFAHSYINAITIRVAVCVLTLLNCLFSYTNVIRSLGDRCALTFLCRLWTAIGELTFIYYKTNSAAGNIAGCYSGRFMSVWCDLRACNAFNTVTQSFREVTRIGHSVSFWATRLTRSAYPRTHWRVSISANLKSIGQMRYRNWCDSGAKIFADLRHLCVIWWWIYINREGEYTCAAGEKFYRHKGIRVSFDGEFTWFLNLNPL